MTEHPSTLTVEDTQEISGELEMTPLFDELIANLHATADAIIAGTEEGYVTAMRQLDHAVSEDTTVDPDEPDDGSPGDDTPQTDDEPESESESVTADV